MLLRLITVHVPVLVVVVEVMLVIVECLVCDCPESGQLPRLDLCLLKLTLTTNLGQHRVLNFEICFSIALLKKATRINLMTVSTIFELRVGSRLPSRRISLEMSHRLNFALLTFLQVMSDCSREAAPVN